MPITLHIYMRSFRFFLAQVHGSERSPEGVSRPGQELGQAGRAVGASGAARLRALLLAHL